MSFIRTSSQRKYSKGYPMYVFCTAGKDIDWMAGNPSKSEDLTEIICRVVHQSGIDLTESQINNIRNRLGLEELDEPHTERLDSDDVDEMLEGLSKQNSEEEK